MVKGIQAVSALAFGMLLAFAPQSAFAQSEGTASLTGIVFDSTEMTALGGARVAVIGTRASTDADERGEFRLDGIPAGTHWVSFYHHRLQSLGVSPPSRQVTFSDGEAVRLELAVPSEETLLLAGRWKFGRMNQATSGCASCQRPLSSGFRRALG